MLRDVAWRAPLRGAAITKTKILLRWAILLRVHWEGELRGCFARSHDRKMAENGKGFRELLTKVIREIFCHFHRTIINRKQPSASHVLILRGFIVRGDFFLQSVSPHAGS